jgi:hypothetical protein
MARQKEGPKGEEERGRINGIERDQKREILVDMSKLDKTLVRLSTVEKATF